MRRLAGGLGALLLIYAATFLVPILVALFYDAGSGTTAVRLIDLPGGWTWRLPETAILFALVGLGVLFLGGTLLWLGLVDDEIRHREAYAIVGLGWLVLAVVGAFPYLVLGALRPVDAFFESMSGITTTGATVLSVPYGQYAPSLMAWRAVQQWLGGLGIIVLMVAVLAGLTHGGMQLMSAEKAGAGVERVKPRLVATAMAFWRLYAVYTLVLAAVLAALMHTTGVELPLAQAIYEGMIHSFTSLSTGGFSNHEESIAFYRSFWVELVLLVAMVVMGISFAVHYLVWQGLRPWTWHRGRSRSLGPLGLNTWRQVTSHAETRFYLRVVFALGALVSASLWFFGDYEDPWLDLWYGFLQTVSIVTTTGYNPVPFDRWNESARFLLFLMFFLGGCAGSTAGGFKMVRILILARLLGRQLRLLLHPRALIHVRVGTMDVSGDALRTVTVFSFTYLMTFVLGALAYALLGLDLVSAMAASASGVGNIGPALGAVHADFHAMPTAGRLVHTALMWAGRLEIFTVLILLLPETWRR